MKHLPILLPLCLLSGVLGCGDEPDEPVDVDVTIPSGSLPDIPVDQDLLAESERQFVWDVEHAGFLVEQTVFPLLKRALRGDRPAHVSLEAIYAPDFKAETRQPLVSVSNELVRAGVTRHKGLPETDAFGFSAWLDSQRARFDPDVDDCRVQLGLVRLAPISRDKPDGRWSSVWKLRMAGQHEGGPKELNIRMKVELLRPDESLANSNGWLHGIEVTTTELIEADRYLMEDATAASGIDIGELHDNWQSASGFIPNTGGIYLSDYNADGNLDLLIDDLKAGVRLYRGHGDATFTDATVESGLDVFEDPPLWTLSTWADFDGDGDDDLIAQDRLFRNDGDGTFTDITPETNLRLTPAAGYAVADFDLDGRVDLYVCHSGTWHAGGSSDGQRVPWIDGGLGVDNVLWKNLGDWQFEDVTDELNVGGSGSSSFSAVWLHANNDRRPDLFAINEFGRNSLLLSTGGDAWRETDVDPVFGGFSMGVAAGDFNNDGHRDLYVANMYSKAGNRILANVDQSCYPEELYNKIVEATTGNKLYLATGNGTFEALDADSDVPDIGWAYGATFTDLDGDGWEDIYATAGFKSETRGKPDG